jgi:hypothetical protein
MRNFGWYCVAVIGGLLALPLLGSWLVLGALWLADSLAPSKPYTAPTIEGQVVDATDKRPLAGVLIVARWEEGRRNLEDHPGEPGTGHAIQVVEVATKDDGSFVMPGWGPRDIGGRMEVDVSFLFLQPGYEAWVMHTYGVQYVELRRGTLNYATVYNELNPTFRAEGCLWQKAPRTVDVLLAESKDERRNYDPRGWVQEGIKRAEDRYGRCDRMKRSG